VTHVTILSTQFCQHLPSDKDTHATQHDEQKFWIHVAAVRELGEEAQEDNQHAHESTNNDSTASTENIGNVSNNDTSRHHTNRVERCDKIGGDIIKNGSKEVWQPEEEDVVGKLEKSEGKRILCNHWKTNGSQVGNGGRASICLDGLSSFGHFLLLGFILRQTDLDLGGDDTDCRWVRNELHSPECPCKIGEGWDQQSIPVRKTDTQDPSSAQSGSHITAILMACPESEDGSAVLDRCFVAEPISHYGSSDGSSSGLEETEEEVYAKDEQVGEADVETNKVKPDGHIDEEETGSTSEETNGENSGWVESVTKLSVDDVSSSVSSHEDSVHGREKKLGPSGLIFELSLDGRIALARKVGHEVSTERNEEGPSVNNIEKGTVLALLSQGFKRKRYQCSIENNCHSHKVGIFH
jgi:hypothetical protein